VRILLATHAFPPQSHGGTEQYTLALAKHLRRLEHDVSVLTYAPGDTRQIIAHDEEYEGLPVRRLAFDPDRTDDPVRDEYDNPRVAAFLNRSWREDRPDVLHVTHLGLLSTATLRVAREMAIATVVTLTDMWAICPAGTLVRSDGNLCVGPHDIGECVRCLANMGPRGRRYATLSRSLPAVAWRALASVGTLPLARQARPLAWLASLKSRSSVVRGRILRAEALLSPGRFLPYVLGRNGYPPERIRFLPHGIEQPERLARLTPAPVDGTLRLGYVGPLQPHKGAHLPIQAFGSLGRSVGVTLDYWGSRPQEPDAYARDILERIDATPGARHHGPYGHEHVGEVMQEIDILIMPSLCYENTPTVMYEAFASGTPVIATDSGGMRELVHEYCGGWLTPRGDATALAGLIARLANNRQEITSMVGRIRPVPRFSDHVAALEQIYRQALDTEKPA